jgi:hypothetical protein
MALRVEVAIAHLDGMDIVELTHDGIMPMPLDYPHRPLERQISERAPLFTQFIEMMRLASL